MPSSIERREREHRDFRRVRITVGDGLDDLRQPRHRRSEVDGSSRLDRCRVLARMSRQRVAGALSEGEVECGVDVRNRLRASARRALTSAPVMIPSGDRPAHDRCETPAPRESAERHGGDRRPVPDVVVVGAGVVGARSHSRFGARSPRRRARTYGRRRGAVRCAAGRRAPAVGHDGRLRARAGVARVVARRPGAARLAIPLAFSSCGYLFLAHSRGGARAAHGERPRPERRGRPVAHRRRRPRRPALVPGLETVVDRRGSYGARRTGTSTSRRPRSLAIARQLDVRDRAVERSSPPTAGGWVVETPSGTLQPHRSVVIAAGADTRAISSRPLGVELPIEPEPRHLFLSAPIRERLLEPLVISPSGASRRSSSTTGGCSRATSARPATRDGRAGVAAQRARGDRGAAARSSSTSTST